jgi:transcription antitermination factor NusG
MTNQTQCHVGDRVYTFNTPQQIEIGEDGPPTWHCVIVHPQCEAKARAYFRARDVFAFYPSETRTRHVRGKKIETERPCIPGHLYVQFRKRPQWHVLKARRIIAGIFCTGNVPVAIHPTVIRHLQGLTVEAQRLAEARAEMLRVREGDKATIISGALAGLVVDVGQITGDEVWLNLQFGGRIKASIKSLERHAAMG